MAAQLALYTVGGQDRLLVCPTAGGVTVWGLGEEGVVQVGQQEKK